jgi:C-terminal processing protease CtpA/Prc
LEWDKELLQIAPTVLESVSHDEVVEHLVSWIERLNSAEECDQTVEDRKHLRPPINGIKRRAFLGPELRNLLQSIAPRSVLSEQFYVTLRPGVGNPVFQNEVEYSDSVVLDWRYQLLALFRFWNIIEYWFPYRDVMGEDWDAVLSDFIPRLFAARNRQDYLLEMAMVVAKVHDSHANLRDALYVRPPAGRKLPPFSIRLVEGQPFIWRRFDIIESDPELVGATSADQLRFGDLIRKVDGRPVDGLFQEAGPYVGASNETSKAYQISQFLLKGDDDDVLVEVERYGQVTSVTNRRVPRESLDINVQHWHDRDGEAFQLLSEDVAYLKLSIVESEKVTDYIRAAAETKGLIIDVRSYPSDSVVFSLGQHLVDTSTPFVRFTHGDLTNPGSFVWTEPLAIEPKVPYYDGKVTILVDEATMSSAEYHAMAFRAAPNAVVIGSQTAGADGNFSAIPLPGGLSAGISGIGVFYPDKTPTQRVGIVPDIEISPTIAGLRAGRDEVLEEALRQILGEVVSKDEIEELASF